MIVNCTIKQDRSLDDFPDLVNDACDSRFGIIQARRVCLVCNFGNSLHSGGLKFETRQSFAASAYSIRFLFLSLLPPLPNAGSSASARNLEMERLLSFSGLT
jgi:hypothetical protein